MSSARIKLSVKDKNHFIYHHQQNYTPRWKWPIDIRYVPLGMSVELPDWSDEYYVERFTKLYISDAERRHYNILMSPIENSELELSLRSVSQWNIDSVDYIILYTSNSVASFNNLPVDLLNYWVRRFNSGGISIVCRENINKNWQRDFLIELSHDKDLVEALQSSTPEGLHYISRKVRHAAKLSTYLTALGVTLGSFKGLDAKLEINTEDVRFIQKNKNNIQDLSREILEKKDGLPYHSESSSATDIKILNEAIESEIPGFESDYRNIDFRNLNRSYKNEGVEIRSSRSRGVTPPRSGRSKSTRGRGSSKDGKKKTAKGKKDSSGVIYLQSIIQDENMDKHWVLLPQSDYNLIIRYGPDLNSWATASEGVPKDDFVFDQEGVAEMFFVILIPGKEKIKKDFKLFKDRQASQPVQIPITTDGPNKPFICEVMAYHKNRMFQRAIITCPVVEKIEDAGLAKLHTEVVESIRLSTAFFSTSETADLSIDLRKDGDKKRLMQVSGDQIDIKFENSFEDKVENLTYLIQAKMLSDDSTQQEFDSTMIDLAQSGRELFDNIFKGRSSFGDFIQIISDLNDYFPLEFIYTYPPPSNKAAICKKALAKSNTENKCCGTCFDINSDKVVEHYCPYGFLGLRTKIERFKIGDKREFIKNNNDLSLLLEPLPGRSELVILDNPLYATANRVDAVQSNLSNDLNEALKKISKKPKRVKTWKSWVSNVQSSSPRSLVLIVHTEKNDKGQDVLEIGADLKEKIFISKDHVLSEKHPNPPFVILIGCNTTNPGQGAFDFSAHFINKGAAIVLSNIAEITGRKAALITKTLISTIENLKGKNIKLGELVLKMRQELLTQKIIAGLSVVAHGDADWTIKI